VTILVVCGFRFIYSAIGFGDLTPELQQELQKLQKRMAVDLQPLVLESSLTMQKMLEAEDHKARCRLLKYFMQAEITRLTTKKSLQGIFATPIDDTAASLSPSVSAAIPPEEMATEAANESEEATTSSAFFDEPDAFQ
jgi:hypothetical protein